MFLVQLIVTATVYCLEIFYFHYQASIQDPNFIGFCYEDELFPGDFDADGRSDFVCRKDGGSEYQIALSGP